MRITKPLSILLLSFCTFIIFQSCQNELDTVPVDTGKVEILKAPKVTAWSGNNNFNRYATRASEGDFYNIKELEEALKEQNEIPSEVDSYWDKRPQSTDKGESVSKNEFDYVMAYIMAHLDEASEYSLSKYFIQNVGVSPDSIPIPEGKLYISGVEIVSYSAGEGDRGLCLDIPVNTSIDYVDENDETIGFQYKLIKITLPNDKEKYGDNAGKSGIYLCMDFDKDGDYTDWVVKLLPGMKGNGSNSGNGEGNTETNEPEESTPDNHQNEVEVNLSINDTHENYDIEDLVSKLSIHVRYPHDVRITIPVPTKYVVEADDLDIVLSHKLETEIYGSEHEATYNVGGNEVKLTVKYVEDGENTNIVITTHGINEDVIAYCYENYGDGINFEVWNYFAWNELNSEGKWVRMSDKIDIQTIKKYLDNAYIEFDVCNPQREDCGNVCPDYYINAFGSEYKDGNEQPKKNDCNVEIKDSQRGEFQDEVKTKEHLNGSPYNEIYVKNGKTPDELH